jgi:Zn-dependent M28 family amino/carboxypeptidase
MWPLLASPLLAMGSALTGSRLAARLGALLGLGYAASMADIGRRDVVPGANDNGTAVVLLVELARRLVAEPTASTRVILLSTGSEESFSEGMKGFGERYFPELPRDRTFFLCVDTVGSPTLNVLRGEGFVRMHEYPAEALALVDGLADELGIELVPNLRLRNGTDGLEPLAAGYPTATLCSVTELKQPANYHWPTDTPENVDYDTLADAIRLSEAVVRRLDERWLG